MNERHQKQLKTNQRPLKRAKRATRVSYASTIAQEMAMLHLLMFLTRCSYFVRQAAHKTAKQMLARASLLVCR